MNTIYDVLIIGSGIAGLSCALKLAENQNLRIAIATRERKPEITNTYWAQGGIIYVPPGSQDEQLVQDINWASSYTSNLEAAEVLLSRSGRIVNDVLIKMAKTSFEVNGSGDLEFTREAAHSRDRIIYKGDYTGKEIQISLLNLLSNKSLYPNITFLTAHTAIDLITPNHHGISLHQRYEDSQVLGAFLLDQDSGRVLKVMAKKTVLATGGIGALYLHHSNAEGARGDGHAMAARAGASLINMEFVQFHPTTFYDRSSHRRFLISEAVRGEGATLINSKGEAFMGNYHPDRELAPRDVVSRAIQQEMIETKEDCVYMDISYKGKDWLEKRFPTIFQYCLEKRIDISKEPIPVVPAAHYTCGGVKTDLKGRANLKNLYAVGEVGCSGLHGANRLASTSLLEGLTWGQISAEDILESINSTPTYDPEKIRDWQNGALTYDSALVAQDWMMLKQSMWNYAGLIRSKKRLIRSKNLFTELYGEIQDFYKHSILHDELIGLRNAVEVGTMVINASLRNKISVGCFYRLD